MALWTCPACKHIYDGFLLTDGNYVLGYVTIYEKNDKQIPVLYCFNKDLIDIPPYLLLDYYGIWLKYGGFWLNHYYCHKCGHIPDMRLKKNKCVNELIIKALLNKKHISRLLE